MRIAQGQQEENKLKESLDHFRCYLNKDIESFLRFRAIEFELRGYCTVYLLLDSNEFYKGNIFVVAYFTLSHKAIMLQESVSRTIRGKISTKRDSQMVHFVLIGQLGKYIRNDTLENKYMVCVSSENILNDAFDMIKKSSEFIVCRGVLVECNMEEKVHDVYTKYGFSFLQSDDIHYQFYKKI